MPRRYNLRQRDKNVKWVKDETLKERRKMNLNLNLRTRTTSLPPRTKSLRMKSLMTKRKTKMNPKSNLKRKRIPRTSPSLSPSMVASRLKSTIVLRMNFTKTRLVNPKKRKKMASSATSWTSMHLVETVCE